MATIRLMELSKLPKANNTSFPYVQGEKVQYLGEYENNNQPLSFTKQFIKVFRFKYKREEFLSRAYFKKLGNWEYDGKKKSK